MLTPQEAITIVLADIQRRGEAIDSICSHAEVRLELAAPLRNRQGVDDIYVVHYSIPWGLDGVSIFVELSVYTGEIYDRIGPAPYRG